jgi:membrane protease subunit (stomatin/prohibitin family)
MPQVIEWTNAGPDDVVWRYPVEQIITGAQLVVHEFEAAVFFRDGKAYDVFPPGRHTLTTLNLPLISKAYGIFFGGKNPFTAIVIYVSTKQFAGKWGAKAQTTELAPLMVHGTAWFRIKDPNLFVNEVVGGQGAYNTGQVNDALSRLGTDLVDFKFEGIDTSDQFRDRLFWIKQRAATSDVLRMETAKDIGASLGASQGGGAGLGAGMVLIPQVMNAQMQQPMMQPQAQVAFVACPKCGNQVQQGARFCPNCGNTMTPPQAATTPCPNCGKPVNVGAKFCPECGQKI